MMKRCSNPDCPHGDELLPAEMFHRNHTKADGRASHCKDCANERQRLVRRKGERGWLRYRLPIANTGVGTPKDLLDAGLEKVARDLQEFRRERQA